MVRKIKEDSIFQMVFIWTVCNGFYDFAKINTLFNYVAVKPF